MCDVLRALLRLDIQVSATLSPGAREFVSPLLFRSLGADPVYDEMFTDANVFAHLEPGAQAQAMLIAPASANLLSRLATGSAQDMLSAQFVAFAGPCAIAPAMNPRMWAHKATRENVKTLVEWGASLIPPALGDTACGEQGRGRLADSGEIFLGALRLLAPQDMAGINVLVTLGPTREMWDGVRYWSNPSSGRMGGAIATCCWLRGANVTAICGPGINVFLPEGIERISVNCANEMYNAAKDAWPKANMGFFSAAVADFAPIRPENADDVKIKKAATPGNLEIEFSRNPDILATLSADRGNGQKALGFAAEITPDMQSLLPLARLKLNAKKADVIAANRVNPASGAFGADDGSMAVVDAQGHEEIWQPQSKADIAWELCSWLLRI